MRNTVVKVVKVAVGYAVFLGGCGAVVYGVWSINEAAGWIAGGLFSIGLAVISVAGGITGGPSTRTM